MSPVTTPMITAARASATGPGRRALSSRSTGPWRGTPRRPRPRPTGSDTEQQAAGLLTTLPGSDRPQVRRQPSTRPQVSVVGHREPDADEHAQGPRRRPRAQPCRQVGESDGQERRQLQRQQTAEDRGAEPTQGTPGPVVGRVVAGRRREGLDGLGGAAEVDQRLGPQQRGSPALPAAGAVERAGGPPLGCPRRRDRLIGRGSR